MDGLNAMKTLVELEAAPRTPRAPYRALPQALYINNTVGGVSHEFAIAVRRDKRVRQLQTPTRRAPC